MQVNAIDRIGEGPWYDRIGRVVAMTKTALANTRPMGADPAIINDLPNEDGVPNKRRDPAKPPVNNHHVLTGSDASGKLYKNTSTCNDWTSTAQSAGRPAHRLLLSGRQSPALVLGTRRWGLRRWRGVGRIGRLRPEQSHRGLGRRLRWFLLLRAEALGRIA
jgi:hypothetical protein